MSYILDALKKAESERNLGAIPNVYAQPAQSASNAMVGTNAPGRRTWLPRLSALVAVAMLLVAGGAGIAWLQPWQSQPAPASDPVRSLAPPATQTVQNPVAPASAPATVPKIASVDAQPPTPTADQAVEKPVGTLQDLPENIQRELPPIVVSGYIYAGNPADRSVLIEKRLLHEGDRIGPDLVLEKMMPSGAVLNYKGYRYRVAY